VEVRKRFLVPLSHFHVKINVQHDRMFRHNSPLKCGFLGFLDVEVRKRFLVPLSHFHIEKNAHGRIFGHN
jgi:hypothetical protein